MSQFSTLKSIFLAGAALTIVACTQGENIASPGATASGGTGGGSTGGGTGGGNTGGTCTPGFTQTTTPDGTLACNLSGTITGNLRIQNLGLPYFINGRVDVGVDVGGDGMAATGAPGTLTIDPGVTLFGRAGSDYIVVNRGSRIEADGNAANPIVFTSEADIARRTVDPTDAGGSAIGEWGGLVILGRAPINRCGTGTLGTASCQNAIEGVTSPDALYGGALDDDNSGTLRYVQVRFAGFAINTLGNELNGISLGGVGYGTTIDYVQVHNNSDDGIEMFGGTANLKHIVLTGNDDDSLDTDNGWNGNVQFLLVQQRADGGDNGFEMSSVISDMGVPLSPATNPTIANYTLIGARSSGKRINDGHIGRFLNGVVKTNLPSSTTPCLDWEDAGNNTSATYDAGLDPEFNSVLFDCGGALDANAAGAAAGSVAADANNDIGMSSLMNEFFPGPNEALVTEFDLTTLTTLPAGFFDDTDYIGAFDPDESLSANWATGWTFALFGDPGCPVGTTQQTRRIEGKLVCSVSGTLTTDTTLTSGNFYELLGRVDVGVDEGGDGNAPGGDVAELTIEAGATIFGNSGSDYLVVNRGSKIFANGLPTNPIVFTSEADVLDTQADPTNAIGEWGGLVILGKAPINRCGTGVLGTASCQNAIEGVTSPDAFYGGATADDSSGSLQYVQVKYAGFAINTLGNELNGISFGGVGYGTTVDYVQVHNNSDDGIEMFGGTANLKHIVLTGNDDDSLDTDNGWNGNVQFLIVGQRATGGDNGFEMSSVISDMGVPLSPATNPTIANYTLVGARSSGQRINDGHIGRFINGVIVTGGTTPCLDWEDAGDNTSATYDAGLDPEFNSVAFDCGGALDINASGAASGSVAADSNNVNPFTNSLIQPALGTFPFINSGNENGVDEFDLSTLTTSPAGFFDDVTYVGAVSDANDTWWSFACGLGGSTSPC